MDVIHLIQHSNGFCSLCTACLEGDDLEQQFYHKILQNPLLDHGAVIVKAKAILCGVMGGEDLGLLELQQIDRTVNFGNFRGSKNYFLA